MDAIDDQPEVAIHAAACGVKASADRSGDALRHTSGRMERGQSMHGSHAAVETLLPAQTPLAPADAAGLRIDRVHLSRYTMGNLSLEREILALFVDQLPSLMSAIIDSKSTDDLYRAAHTLKGSSRAIGAWRLADVATRIEEQVHAAQSVATASPDPAALRVLFDQLNSEADATLKAVADAGA